MVKVIYERLGRPPRVVEQEADVLVLQRRVVKERVKGARDTCAVVVRIPPAGRPIVSTRGPVDALDQARVESIRVALGAA